MAEWRRLTPILVAAGLAASTSEGHARVQDYQIVRLLTFRSQCDVERLVEQSAASGPLRYFATCVNSTFYPDGVEVSCNDRDDERSCRILTQALRFDSLDLLRR